MTANILRILEVNLPLIEMREFYGMGYIRNKKNDNAILIMSPWDKELTLSYLIDRGFFEKNPANIDRILINFEDEED